MGGVRGGARLVLQVLPPLPWEAASHPCVVIFSPSNCHSCKCADRCQIKTVLWFQIFSPTATDSGVAHAEATLINISCIFNSSCLPVCGRPLLSRALRGPF